MTITLITPEIHAELTALADAYPDLVFQNKGYEYIGRVKREAHAPQIARIEEILKKHVVGFARFFNFVPPDERRGLTLRFDYGWDADSPGARSGFVGVGYLPLDWLRDGFPKSIREAIPGSIPTT